MENTQLRYTIKLVVSLLRKTYKLSITCVGISVYLLSIVFDCSIRVYQYANCDMTKDSNIRNAIAIQ